MAQAGESFAAGRLREAVDALRKGIRADPFLADGYSNLTVVLERLGRLDESRAAGRAAVALAPDQAAVYYNLGVTLSTLGQSEDAAVAYRRSIALNPDDAEAQSNLGAILCEQGFVDQAIASCLRAIFLDDGMAAAHANLGAALKEKGLIEEAITASRRAIALDPNLAKAHADLGAALVVQGRSAAAVEACRKAIVLNPHLLEARLYLSAAFHALGRLDDAIACCEHVLDLRPDYAEALYNRGNALHDSGRLDEAVACYRRALDLKPDDANAHSNLLMSLHYSTGYSSAAIFEQARAFARRMERPSFFSGFDNLPDPNRKLRIGYVSADFRIHPVGFFLVRVLEAQRSGTVETICYSNSSHADAMTERLRASTDQWRSIVGVPDADVAEMIRSDGIDILVDLSGHTGKNRLTLFARRPAPVQVTWLGYFGTTGLSSIDYILADRFVAPVGEESFFSEKVWRLPGCYLCYSPHPFDIAVGPFPALANGFVTFGCFNNRTKISAKTVAVWATLLKRVENSRLFLKSKNLADERCRATLLAEFADHGVDGERLILEGPSPLTEALAAYNRVDIALDPFPFGGGTTTAETLWMGVPLVALQGARWTGRMSQSILATLGLENWVAKDTDDYIEIACRLTADLPNLAPLRAELRQRLENSAFCDGPGFAKSLEEAFRGMWGKWCAVRLADGQGPIVNR